MSTSTKSVRGLGAAGRGTEHHIRQRVSAIALLFLVPWFLYSVAFAFNAGYSGAVTWLSQPLNAILFILLTSAALYHMRLGLQVVIEDYIEKAGSRQALLILNTFVAAVLFAATVLSVLKLWIGSAG
jgi:succinate dehydrogenase / fumarate reductase membrane anchor subunit